VSCCISTLGRLLAGASLALIEYFYEWNRRVLLWVSCLQAIQSLMKQTNTTIHEFTYLPGVYGNSSLSHQATSDGWLAAARVQQDLQ
jgi:hypothetical protein